jgi:hypothetical protein
MKRMGKSMVGDRTHTGITKQNLIRTLCGWVTLVSCLDITVQQLSDRWQLFAKGSNDNARDLFAVVYAGTTFSVLRRLCFKEPQLATNLLLKQLKRILERIADEIGDTHIAELRSGQTIGKEGGG